MLIASEPSGDELVLDEGAAGAVETRFLIKVKILV